MSQPSPSPTPAAPASPASPEPTAAASIEPARPSIRLKPLSYADPLRWLALGWADFRRAPGIGLFYGVCFVAMGWALLEVFQHAPAYTLALCAGFVLVGPLLALGLYRVSQRLGRGEQPDLGDSLLAWEPIIGQMAIFGFALLVMEMLWARATLVVFAVSFDGIPDFKGSLLALTNPENIAFTAVWLAVGALFAGLIYAMCVVAIPMILDTRSDAITAAITSMRLFFTQMGVMLWWGFLIAALVLLAMLPWFLGLVVIGPLLGHASWHAYKGTVSAS